MKPLFTTAATSQGGRDGRVVSEDGVIDLDVRAPKEMGGPGGHATNPEQLFAAGYSTCFNSALNLVIRKERVSTGNPEVTANVSIGKDSDGGYGLAAKLQIKIPDVDRETAQKLVKEASKVCPYAKATRGNIEVEYEVL
ncbi:peroxiredoxin, Ohr subfamily [Marininema mesophilum]|uniref:Peroxiredoxin, Ohr subfamily n=1 Tax=Marininema mesophilum TaxID=1048340 RepID=A0A1H3BP63_9BACL|nr:organic hydroperoxide resistance protein [Marininema mesophilum]SDX42939.1 peroxiredoxin, Ohr subfamily [Marininema mesophilum]